MKAFLCILLASSLGIAGCGKKAPPVKPSAERKAKIPSMVTAPLEANTKTGTPPPPPGVRAPTSHEAVFIKPGEKDADGRDVGLVTINEALQHYMADTGSPPARVEDLVKVGRLARVPIPPEGMRYAIDPEKKTAVLVSK